MTYADAYSQSIERTTPELVERVLSISQASGKPTNEQWTDIVVLAERVKDFLTP